MIDADKLKKDILALQDCCNGFSDTYDKACIIGVIDEQPTIEERKAGKWIGKYPVTSICSECGFLINDSKVRVFAFCPNCGADMRGGNQ